MKLGSSANLAVLSDTPAATKEKEEKKTLGPEAHEQRDLFVRAQRRKLSDERKSVTHKFSVGSHEGYLIVGMYEDGVPGEVFIKMSKEGSTLSGFMDGLAISISIGLDYIARWLGGRFISLDYLKRGTATSVGEVVTPLRGTPAADAANVQSDQVGDRMAETAGAPSCPTCGMLMSPNGSCFKCMNCGGTSGCS